MRTSTLTGKLMLAIRAVQSAKPLAAKSGTVKIDGAQQRIEKFAPHDEIWEDLQPLCAANGLTVTQFPDVGANGCAILVTRITWTNDDGTEEQWAEGSIPVVPPRPGFRELGASWSYERRIMLLSCFGIVAGGDEPDQQEADKLRHVKPPRDDGQRPHMAPVDSEARATELLRELDALPVGTTLVTVNELSKSFADLTLCDETRAKVGAAFSAKRASLGLPDKPVSKRKQ
ncbi:MAG: hypothetical protein E6Q97_21840 [Desulfurellales bacterium]|nr:MAG: hypothetical protein E6Q97_21840 [Desulfurellales bacterium]